MLAVTACSSDSSTKEEENWEDGFVEDSITKPVDTDTIVDKAPEQLDPITLTVHYFSQDDFTLEALKKAAAGYKASHPEVSVEWKLHLRTQPVKLAELIEPGEAQDLYWVEIPEDLQDFVKDGLVQDLSSYQGEFGSDAYYASLASSLMIDGGTYGFPITNDTELIYYNKNLVTGDAVPTLDWTYEDMIHSVKTVMKEKQLRVGLEQGARLLLPAGQSYGGEPLNEEQTKLVLDTSFRQGLSLMLSALKTDEIGGQDAVADDFVIHFNEGNIPMMVGHSQQLKILLSSMSDVDVAPFPAGPMKQQGIGNVGALAVSKKSEHSDKAIEFAQYMSGSEEANIVYATEHVTMPLLLTDKVREAWRNSFKDPTLADRLAYIVKTNAGSMYSKNGEPGYYAAIMRLSILLNDTVRDERSNSLDASFDQELDRINADWALTQEEAKKP
ncbi:extracellular solute-binding protein [Paenibacillus sp. CCS19]|uniref:extracellular solute-binding protein n=1 Tax=Paenibacillus sp. CCS19 TaxID=3158387 RepID=UPI00295ED87A|nr:extracellular solute-binding protein [Paenibacillus cellulosilyticus]